MSEQNNDTDLSDVPTGDDALPGSVRVTSRNGDAWYEYGGDLLWDAEMVVNIWERFKMMHETEWSRVGTTPYGAARGKGSDVKTNGKIRTQDDDDFMSDLKDRADSAGDEIDGWLTKRQAPQVTERGPRRTDVRINYSTGSKVSMGGPEYKRGKLVGALADFENYLFHERVFLPVLEQYEEQYPY